MYPLKREVLFVNSLPLDVIAIVVGWMYTIFWIIYYYPQVLNDIMGKVLHLTFYFSCVYFYLQKYYSCKRGSVAGLNFNFVGMCFTGNAAYLIFNVSLFWIPQVQVTS